MGGKKKGSRRKKKKRSNGDDDSSSSSSDDSEEDENDELKNKLLAKATKKLVAQMKTDSVAGGLYTDEKNPFNDENLTEKFVWSKKIEKEGKKAVQNLTDKDAQLEREEEIKKIELRRIEYEKARAEREEERDQKMREKAMEGAEELEEKEEKFHFNQLLLRADIRYKNGRAKPIDTLLRALYGSAFTSALKSEKELAAMKAFNKEFDSKNSLFKYMTEKDLQELKDECVNVLKLIDETSEKEKEYKLFWTCVYRLTETELGEEEEDKLTEMDVEMMESVDLSGSLEELTDLEQEINRSINEDLDDDTEISFWRKAMKRVTLAKLNRQCRETLAKVYEESKKNIKFVVVEKKDGKEEKENYDNDEDDEDLLGGDDFAKRVRDDKDDDDGKEEEDDEEEEEEDDDEEEDEEALLANIDVTYGDEPKPLSKEESAKLLKLYEEQQQRMQGEGEDLLNFQEVIVLIDEDEDAENLRRLRAAACEKFAKEQLEKKLEKQRRYQQERMKRQKGKISSDEEDVEDQEEEKEKKTPEQIQQEADDLEEELKAKRYAEKQMGKLEDGDIAFTGEVEQKDLGDRELYWWHNKYKPRKPRYFNRVHTGYEWNKYNSTHYDHDNPPPKTVQGYKFNVFYPDLIDSSKAPTYKCERDVSAVNDDTCILKISSGPPYEDVAFRIVNKEWEYSHKRGFKCTFERGIFHLYVNFKRPRYRR